MRTFAQLLTEYTTRTGVSDAELARAVGVQRQTIFRWKEGLVAHPRSAEDVLRLAAKLRLSAEERDLLLLAAGFPPQTPSSALSTDPRSSSGIRVISASSFAEDHAAAVVAGSDPAAAALDAAPATPPPAARPRGRFGRTRSAARSLLIAACVVLVVVVAGWLAWRWRGGSYPTARQGETLVILGQFANFAGGQQGYNIAGRLQTTLKRELDAARLPGARAVIWPEAISSEEAARAAVQRSGAALVIWGEFDSGRVLARLTLSNSQPQQTEPRWEKLLSAPGDLTTTINADLPEEVRSLALMALGQLYAEKEDYERGRAILTQALARPPADPGALASLYFSLGYLQQVSKPPDLSAAIDAYTQALALNPAMLSTRNNRATAYLHRGKPDDLERAVEDLSQIIEASSADAVAHTNRGAAYLQLKRPGDLERAIQDLDRAVSLAPAMVEAYFNRGLARLHRNDRPGALADLQQASALDAQHAGAYAALCWAFALEREPESALPYCDRAVTLEPNGPGRDSRGIVYAELGRFPEAIHDVETYLQANPAFAGRAEREAWLDAMRAGRDPFDQATLDRLRQE